MNDVVIEQIEPARDVTRHWASGLWFAATYVWAGAAANATAHGVTLACGGEVDASRPRARLCGLGFRGDPGVDGSLDANVRAAHDALARSRRGPRTVDAVIAPASLDAVLATVFGADVARVARIGALGGLEGLAAAVRAIESGRARRVLVVDVSVDTVAQAALVETTTDGSPPGLGRGNEDGCVIVPLEHDSPRAALLASGFSIPVPAALEVGLLLDTARNRTELPPATSPAFDTARNRTELPPATSPAFDPRNRTELPPACSPAFVELVRGFELRGTVAPLPHGARFADTPRAVAHALMNAGYGTAFLVVADGRAEVVCSGGFERALAADPAR